MTAGTFIVLTALAAGCSSGASTDPPPAPRQVIQLAASTARTVNSFSATVSLHLIPADSAVVPRSVTLTGTVSEWVHPALLAMVDCPTLRMAGQVVPGGMSEIITRREIYVRLSLLGQLLHTGKQWIGLPLSALSASSVPDLNSLLRQLDTSSPLAQAQLLAAAENVRAVGTGTVAGTPVTEYAGRYSLSTALDRVPASQRASLGKAFRQAGIGAGTAAFRVWIDGRHLVRKEITTLRSDSLRETFATTVTSVNQPVTITAPPASQVYAVSPAQLGSAGS